MRLRFTTKCKASGDPSRVGWLSQTVEHHEEIMRGTRLPESVTRDELSRRLKSIEGQARGIQHMLDDGRGCHEIMDQLVALRAATQAAGLQAFQAFALYCLQSSGLSPEEVVTHLTAIAEKLSR
jgi:DNA-binding FrmR family transcriptional regulator